MAPGARARRWTSARGTEPGAVPLHDLEDVGELVAGRRLEGELDVWTAEGQVPPAASADGLEVRRGHGGDAAIDEGRAGGVVELLDEVLPAAVEGGPVGQIVHDHEGGVFEISVHQLGVDRWRDGIEAPR